MENFLIKNLKIDLNDDLSSFEFKLLKTGLSHILDIQDKNKEGSLNGSLKGKVLKSNFTLNLFMTVM